MTSAGNGERDGPVRLAEVARAAGVAVSTVSRALANPNRVSAETRDRIILTARSLGYSVNIAARSLRLGRTRMLLVISSSFRGQPISPVYNQLLRGIYDEARRLDFGLIVKTPEHSDSREPGLFDLAFGGMVDGVLTIADAYHEEDVAALVRAGMPTVSLLRDMTSSGWGSVITRERFWVDTLTDQLAALGHRRFGFVSGPHDNRHETERYGGFMDRLNRLGLGGEHSRLDGGFFGPDAGVAAGRSYLALRERPTAILCASDGLALGFMSAVTSAGLRIPDDVSVTGYDDIEVSRYLTPPLTTIRQPSSEIGEEGVRMLVRQVETDLAAQSGRTPSVSKPTAILRIMDNEIILRGTTGRPPTISQSS